MGIFDHLTHGSGGNWNELGGSHVTSFHVEHFLQLDISSKYQKGKFKLAMYLLQKTGGKISGRK